MTNQYVWIGIVIGIFIAGLGIGYVINQYTVTPNMMAQNMLQMMQNPSQRQQVMKQWMQNPQIMNYWMNTIMSNPQAMQQMHQMMMDDPEHMKQMMKMMQNMTSMIDHDKMDSMMHNNP
jgi:hypothetical protein